MNAAYETMNELTSQTTLLTELGEVRVVATDSAVTGLYFRRQQREPPAGAAGPVVRPDEHPVLAATVQQLGEYLAGERRSFDLPLAPHGNEFQQSVWRLLLEIPYGSTTTYGELAQRLGQPGAAQAVGTANARNPIGIIIPCHRVIGSDGSLTGYAGGLNRKRRLLELEGALATPLF